MAYNNKEWEVIDITPWMGHVRTLLEGLQVRRDTGDPGLVMVHKDDCSVLVRRISRLVVNEMESYE